MTDKDTENAPREQDWQEQTQTESTDESTDNAGLSETKTHTERLEEELADACKQRDEYLDLLQRSQAEFENHKKRTQRDAQNTWVRKKQELIYELLPVIDNLERALAAAGDTGELRQGVELVLRELTSVLERNGVYGFSPAGEAFDPTAHEALSTSPAEDTEAGVVLDVIQKGYASDETIIRPARVVVSS